VHNIFLRLQFSLSVVLCAFTGFTQTRCFSAGNFPARIGSIFGKNKGLLEGVVLCGGEPTLNPELPNLIKQIKTFGFLVKLDTNGSNPQMLKNLLDDNLLDYVAMDVKLPKEKYSLVFDSRQTKASVQDEMLKNIEQSIFILKNSDINFEFRTTVAPAVHSISDIVAIARWIGAEIPGRKPKYFCRIFNREKPLIRALKIIDLCRRNFLTKF